MNLSFKVYRCGADCDGMYFCQQLGSFSTLERATARAEKAADDLREFMEKYWREDPVNGRMERVNQTDAPYYFEVKIDATYWDRVWQEEVYRPIGFPYSNYPYEGESQADWESRGLYAPAPEPTDAEKVRAALDEIDPVMRESFRTAFSKAGITAATLDECIASLKRALHIDDPNAEPTP